MKTQRIITLLCLATSILLAPVSFGQTLGYVPNPVGAYLGSSGSWSPWAAGAGGTPLGYVPPPTGLFCSNDGGVTWTPCVPGGGGGSGTVTQFSAGTLSPLFSTSVATATTTPSLSFTLTSHVQNTVFAGPTSGTAAPTFRALVAADVPTLNQNTTGNAATATALATLPTPCSTGNAPTGILANGNSTGCAAIGGGSSPVVAHAVTPTAEWAFSGSTTGSTEPDITGNGHTLTFAGTTANLVRQTSGGIAINAAEGLGSWGYLSSNLTTFTSAAFLTCSYNYPQNGVSNGQVNGTILGNISGTTGLNIVVPETGHFGEWYAAPSIYSVGSASIVTQATTISADCHVYFFVVGDHLYVDGVEVAYSTQGNSSSGATNGSGYAIGAGNSLASNNYFNGYLLYGVTYGSALTSAQVLAETAYIKAHAGHNPYPKNLSTSRTNTIVGAGDSIMAGAAPSGVGISPLTELTTNITYTIVNYGSGGDTSCAIGASQNFRDFTAIPSQAPYSVYVYQPGLNDLYSGRPAADTWACTKAAALQAASTGATVIVMTIMDSGAISTTQKNDYNTLVRNETPTLAPNIFLGDIAENVFIGADGAHTNTTYFLMDGTHLTTAGATVSGAGISAAINSANGSTSALPSAVTTGRTLTYADNVLVTNITSAQNFPMTSCGYLTGTSVYVYNPSAFVATLVPNGSETINGANTGVAVPAGSAIAFQRNLTTASTGGCYWTTSWISSGSGGGGNVYTVATNPTQVLGPKTTYQGDTGSSPSTYYHLTSTNTNPGGGALGTSGIPSGSGCWIVMTGSGTSYNGTAFCQDSITMELYESGVNLAFGSESWHLVQDWDYFHGNAHTYMNSTASQLISNGTGPTASSCGSGTTSGTASTTNGFYVTSASSTTTCTLTYASGESPRQDVCWITGIAAVGGLPILGQQNAVTIGVSANTFNFAAAVVSPILGGCQ